MWDNSPDKFKFYEGNEELEVLIGQTNQFIVKKRTDFGLYLDSPKGEILLPNKYIPEGTEIGDNIEVFVYKDSEDRMIATTLTPKAQVGDFAYLEVVDTNKFGAFLDWGLEKHLLVPYREQAQKMIRGNSYVVKIILDEITERVIATSKVRKFLDNSNLDVTEGEDIEFLVYQSTDLGFNVIINSQYEGLLFNNEVFRDLQVGDRVKGYIKRIREDNKIDVGLRNYAYEEVPQGKEKIMELLKKEGGFLPFHDKTEPETIKNALEMSKKTFKKAIGSLYKEGEITLEEKGIRIKTLLEK